VTKTAIATLVPRRRAMVCGSVTSVRQHQLPWVRTDVEITDGTGVMVLRFLGRSSVGGIVAGRRVVAQGTPRREGETLVMLNPLYSFDGAG
jgi:hypothetical protein